MFCVQYWVQNEYVEEFCYIVDGNDFDVEWVDFYIDVLKEFEVVKGMIQMDEMFIEVVCGNQIVIIEILMVYIFYNMVDVFGDMFYIQVLKSIEFLFFVYDIQQSIYMDLFVCMQVVVNVFDFFFGLFDFGELIYNGDVDMWCKFGNFLMMCMVMCIVDVDENIVKMYIVFVVEGGMFEGNEDNVLFVFFFDLNIVNLFFIDVVINICDDFVVIDVLVDNFKVMGDFCFDVYVVFINSGEIVGMFYGLIDGDVFVLKFIIFCLSGRVCEVIVLVVIIDFVEVNFLVVEVFQCGIFVGDVVVVYVVGIEVFMNYWGIIDEVVIVDYVVVNFYNVDNWKEFLGW